ncbi:adenosine deaminase family protein [Rhizosaccharibacter radicis]|uniref:adenosine deaminase n=1 Tax=Rhizosaccharibacter radicis TaxID=2782605 RepID=A0ABT1VVA5_9PROT|nr:adenosine deaminase [Acetobacteraceae bacterium KSS12]
MKLSALTAVALLVPLAAASVTASLAAPAASSETSAAALLDRLVAEPARARVFLRAMPKGADLHNHLSGAVYAENYLRWATESGLCVQVDTRTLSKPPCADGRRPLADVLRETPALGNTLIDAMSMRDFTPEPDRPAPNNLSLGDASGHDHFFATFARFDEASTGHVGEMMAEAANRAAEDNISYLELMWYPRVRESAAGGLKHPWHGNDFAADARELDGDIPTLLAEARADTDAAEKRMHEVLGCDGPAPQPGCRVTVRYMTQLLRVLPPQAVFAQLAYSFALVQADRRFVGINIVAPEDNPVALRDYDLHMRAFRFFHTQHPEIRLSLHAGELTMGLVPPEELRFHIREAIEVAGASRIGHGVDISFEDDAPGLLAEMRAKHVDVEINQTSNDVILGVRGQAHPFFLYRAAGVPMSLSTDDEGVSRIDLTNEFLRAATDWHVRYPELKTMARHSLRYSFLPGADLLGDGDKVAGPCAGADPERAPPAACASFLHASEKATQQWRLEADLSRFERRITAERF